MKTGKIIITSACGMILLCIGFFAYQFVTTLHQMGAAANAEYPTIGLIMDVTRFIERNEGNWPTSWEELGTSDELSDHVLIRFDVTSEEILADPDLIHEVIQPVTGPWRVHPDGESSLEQLRERIKFMKDQPG